MASAAAAPSFRSTKKTTNYARLCRLLVDISSHVLREIFDKKHPPGKLEKVLSRPQTHAVLQNLRRKKVLNPSQWGKLYPAIKCSVSSQHFDITLLMVLLRNICCLVAPRNGWDKLPPLADTSLEADIARIKCYRNTVYGHASKASVDDATFNQYWQNIKDALVRLGGAGYQAIIDDLRTECMDPDFEEHYRELLKQWVMDEVSTKERLNEMQENLVKRFDDLEAKIVGDSERRRKKGESFTKKKVKEDVNILILGETGVGKSTWINGIANYLKHSSLQAAMADRQFTVLIPFRFAYTSEEGEGIDVSFGSDANEILATGQSATQSPREYMFETDNAKFHLIDTPGIGDCRGTDKDKENFDNTLAFLTIYDKIHAVVVLLKPNNARLTVAFKFCVLELLTHLHKSLESNIIFAFTNSRGTFYQPGDTLPVLKELLAKHNLKIDVSPSNYFCFDNEAFRYLSFLGLNLGLNFDQENKDFFEIHSFIYLFIISLFHKPDPIGAKAKECSNLQQILNTLSWVVKCVIINFNEINLRTINFFAM
ncbi:uncharacterized protein LOC111342248 isoform X2 [Stylophora pistillata]|nr:uncharacterized protein LOC111342248 isoform X2 [Stylophora pistillata]